jgi:hypothetical protein
MTRHTGTVTRPRYQSAPYRMHPGRREFIHGRIQPMDQPRDRSARYFIGLAIAVATYFAVQEARPLINAASVTRSLVTGSQAVPLDARDGKQ